MENPFNPGEKVITKFMGAEVEVPVTQIYNDEVQIRTADSVLRWRTCKTVWFPHPATPQPVPEVLAVGVEHSADTNTPPPPVEVGPAEPPSPQPSELPGVTQPLPEKVIITTCGQEEAENLKRQRGKRARKAYRKRA